MVSAPVWTGSSWTTPVCQPIAATPLDEKNACAAVMRTSAGQLSGPLSGSGLDQYNDIIAKFTDMGFYWNGVNVTTGTPGSPATNDMFIVSGEYPNSDFCWVQPGTTTVTGTAVYGWCSPNGGVVSCGGGGVGN